MCTVIDYADPSAEKPSLGGGWGLEDRKKRRWLDSEGKRKRRGNLGWGANPQEETPPLIKKKSPPLTLPTHSTKRRGEKREERREF